MPRHSLMVLAALGLVVGLGRTQEASGPGSPKIACAEPDLHFGEVRGGEEFLAEWELENAGSARLDITRVFVKYGSGQTDRQQLQPGERCRISMRAVTPPWNGFRGGVTSDAYTKRVTVTTNDPVTPYFVLTLSGSILPPLNFGVAEVDFGTIPKGARPEPRVFEILSRGSERVISVTADDQRVLASLEPLPGGQGWRVMVSIPEGVPVGELRARLHLTTTAHSQRDLVIPVKARVNPEVRMEPRVFKFPRVRRGAGPVSKAIDIEKLGSPDLRIEDVRVSPEGPIKARVEEVEAGRRYRLIVTVAPEGPDRYVRATVMVKTNCPGETELSLYCYALIESDGR